MPSCRNEHDSPKHHCQATSSESRNRQRMQRLGVLLAKAAIFWPCAGFCIWWAYSMRAQVHGGNHTFLQAVGLTIEMSFLTTVLTSIVWIASPRIHRQATWIGPAVKTAFETAL